MVAIHRIGGLSNDAVLKDLPLLPNITSNQVKLWSVYNDVIIHGIVGKKEICDSFSQNLEEGLMSGSVAVFDYYIFTREIIFQIFVYGNDSNNISN